MSVALPPAQGGGIIDTVAIAQSDLKEGPGGFWHDVFRRLRRNPTAWIGAGIVLAFLLVAALAPLIAPYPETALPGAKYRRFSFSRICRRASMPMTRWKSRTIIGNGCEPSAEPRM